MCAFATIAKAEGLCTIYEGREGLRFTGVVGSRNLADCGDSRVRAVRLALPMLSNGRYHIEDLVINNLPEQLRSVSVFKDEHILENMVFMEVFSQAFRSKFQQSYAIKDISQVIFLEFITEG